MGKNLNYILKKYWGYIVTFVLVSSPILALTTEEQNELMDIYLNKHNNIKS